MRGGGCGGFGSGGGFVGFFRCRVLTALSYHARRGFG